MKTSRRGIGASNAFGWSLLNTAASRFATLGIGILLARVLGPESFGTFAVALVALMAVLSFNELGVSLAIVRWPGDPARIVPTVNTISVAGSAVFCIGAVLVAPHFTAAMGDPGATDVVRVLVLSVFINGVVASPAALLQRRFQEKRRLVIDQVNVWVGALLSVLLALAGMGAMALAIGRVAGGLISALMFLAASPLPYRLGMDRTHVGHLLRFGLPLAGTSIIFFAIGYADQLTAGAILGSTALGFYALAFNLANWPVSMASQPLRRVAPAAFSALQHDKAKMNAAMVSIVTVLASAALPLVFFLAGCAVPAVGFVYGSAWLPAATALSWLVVAATAKVFCDLFYDYLVVCGKTGTVLTIQAGGLLVLLPALIVGTSWYGIAGLGAAQAAVTAALVFPLYIGQLRRCGLQAKDLLAGVWSPLAAGSVVGLIAWAAATLIPNHFLALTASGSCAVAVSAYLLFQRRGQLQLLRSIGRPAPEVISA